MPKRVVDGEAIATSFKIRRIQEEWRIHYPYLLTLALANGTFECDPEVIWAKRYAIFMPGMTKEHVAEMIRAFEAADLLRTWRDKEGRLCGWWVGINKPGRLPPKSRLKRHEEALGPELPRAVLNQPTCNLTAGHQVESVGAVQDGAEETPTEHVRNTSCGLGLGLGSGKNISSKPKDGFDPSVSPKSDGSRPDPELVDLVFPDEGASSSPPVSGEREIYKAAVQRVWDYHIKSLNRNPKLREFTDDRRRKGLARLQEARRKANGDLEKAEELMKLCIDAMAASAFHMGDNPAKQRYDSWENLFGSQKRLEFWLERANG